MVSSVQICSTSFCLAEELLADSNFSNNSSTLRWSAFNRATASISDLPAIRDLPRKAPRLRHFRGNHKSRNRFQPTNPGDRSARAGARFSVDGLGDFLCVAAWIAWFRVEAEAPE